MQELTPDQRAYIEEDCRIPVASLHPAASWIACLAADSLLPTDAELALLRNFIEYEISLYGPEHQADLLALPLAHAHGRNAFIFRKGNGWADDSTGWSFSRSSWRFGSFLPTPPARPHNLLEVINLEESLWNLQSQPSPEWQAWQSLYADLFAALPFSPLPIAPLPHASVSRLATIAFAPPLNGS
jgi:hypothetical protein